MSSVTGSTTNSTSNSNGLNMSNVSDVLGEIVSGKETEINSTLTVTNTDGTTSAATLDDSASVLALQQLMNEWSFTVGMQSSMLKTISDACKSMVQKVS